MPQNRSNRSLGEGNTDSSPKKQSSLQSRYCFTDWLKFYKSKDEAILFLDQFYTKLCNYMVYGFEVCPETKTKHIQGYFELKKRMRITEIIKYFGHGLELAKSKGNRESNYDYCSKDGDFFVKEIKLSALGYTADELGIFDYNDLYAWQKQVIEIIKKGGKDRLIYWYWSIGTKIGKTTITKYLDFWHNTAFVTGKKADILCSIVGAKGDKKPKSSYVFAYPKAFDPAFVSYDALESVKDGIFFSSKYESGACHFPQPVVIVFANFAPDTSKLVKDRWRITCLDDVVDDDDVVVDPKFKISFD